MLTNQDQQIIKELKAKPRQYDAQADALYLQYEYLIDVGCRKYYLNNDDSFTAYTEALFSFIGNIVNGHFDGHSSLSTYLHKIFYNKCVDLVRKNTTNKQSVHKSAMLPELLAQLPDGTRDIVEKLVNEENRRAVNIQMETIGEKCKTILLLFEDGLTDKEIADELSYNTAAVAKTTRLRCLEKLREKVMDFIRRR